jgi:hypothetical protein
MANHDAALLSIHRQSVSIRHTVADATRCSPATGDPYLRRVRQCLHDVRHLAQQPGEGEETAAKRLLQRVFANYSRFVDVVVGDALYFDAPFINFCLDHHKHAIVVIQGDQRLLLQDAQGLFTQQTPGQWDERRRTVRCWDQEGFTSCEGVPTPLRVLHTEETVRRRERVAGQWQEKEETSCWYWATTLSKNQLGTRDLYRAGHGRWDIENDCFNTLSTHSRFGPLLQA